MADEPEGQKILARLREEFPTLVPCQPAGSEVYRQALDLAIEVARAAGDLLRKEFHQPGGPESIGGESPAEDRAEELIRRSLLAAFPDWGFRGEETGHPVPSTRVDPAHVWLVDPNDGTSAFLKGHRGSAVSIALLRDGVPVLGVVYAFAAPDDGGDLFAWAEGCGPLTRNCGPVERAPWPEALSSETVVLVSHNADHNSPANARCAAPGRFRKVVGIAYRLALVAAGEADAAVSLSGPVGWDYAAGHALLRAVGGVLVDQSGKPVKYSMAGESGFSSCFGGGAGLVAELRGRPWGTTLSRVHPEDGTPKELDLVRLGPGQAVADAAILGRAQGCLLGQIAGDALGSLVEHGVGVDLGDLDAAAVRTFHDGGVWQTIAGQPTDDSELALMLARSIVASGGYDREAVARAYRYWYRSKRFGIGRRTRQALEAVTEADVANRRVAEAMAKAASASTRSNGSLMRVSPLGIWGHRLSPDELAGHARLDSALTHPSSVCQEACAVYTVAIAQAITSGCGPAEVYGRTLAWANVVCSQKPVLQALIDAQASPPDDFLTRPTRALIALQNAFYRLLHSPSLEAGVVDTIVAGGDTDTNAAIAGALLGAVYELEAVPVEWRRAVLSCRPITGLAGVRQPRPRAFWPVDVLELVERLLLA